ncbi:MAG: alpha-amylase [Micavibrio sp.]|nr:alpha-amylase [Micavibrio sp.]
MKTLIKTGLCAACIITGAFTTAQQAKAHEAHFGNVEQSAKTSNADDHAPIGVMGDHRHKAGEWMVSYRFMRMHMEGNRDGTDSLSPDEIVTTTPNPFAPPPTLRVVPLEMDIDMHMLGGMYAPSDWLTLMVMGQYIDREMEHLTYAGMAGTTELGQFTTKVQGIGDTSLSGLIGLYDDNIHHLHLNAGLSLPTGSIKEEDDVLTPMGTTPRLRLPYAMQLGSGTYDLLPGLTYYGNQDNWGWGAQYKATIRTGENSQDYTLGDKHQITAWGSYLWTPSFSTSLRATAETEGHIDGMDSDITAPVQTANPDNYGGERLSLSAGANYLFQAGPLQGHRLAFEVTAPVYQDLNGPQMERDYAVTVGWQKAF